MDGEPMLTTIDNPYSPFDQWNLWYAFDEQKGYHTTSYLARVANATFQLGEEEEMKEIDDAIDEIVAFDLIGMYKKVYRKDYELK